MNSGFFIFLVEPERISFSLTRQVKEEMLFEALTTRKTVTVGEKLIVPYKLAEVIRLPCSANMKYPTSVPQNFPIPARCK